ncbi:MULTISPECIES: aminoacyl-tRNA hydrolase [Calditerrivibrio]|uniref:Peptidyl-tRNA hydrolase n=1 Tax=Calditerrivibrio nitroreducens TaxID=477976 RepID=A0A2J6WRK9_9BACT|nr:MAG: aminoacyl-tRNA hydrolase [Calditerrivibrio nitroreducens]
MNRWLVAGLGNPGDKYRLTRHNIGFMVMDMMADRFNLSFKGGFEADYAVADIFAKRCYVVKPQTYMNLSGKSIFEISRYFDIPKENIIVVHDDLDLSFGRIKIKVGGSSGGHNGINSIIASLSFADFTRVKMGIDKPKSKDVSGFVLSEFSADEKKVLRDFVELGCNATIAILEKDVRYAMNLYNKKIITKEVNERCPA